MKKFGTLRHRGFYISLGLGVVAGLVALILSRSMALVVGVNVFFVAYLALTALAAPRLTAEFLKKHAAEEDAPAGFILLVMFAAVVVSAVSLFFVLWGGSDFAPVQLGLGVTSVVLGWFATHTMWALHYAFEYYQAPEASPGKSKKDAVVGGLDFPGDDDPDGIAFIYFAYVVGMTAQTSDTCVTSNAMRKLVTLQGVFSFFFNTVLVAAAVNIVVSLAH